MADSSVPKLFDEQVPLRTEYVLGQGFTRDPGYCKSVRPDERMWPSELDQLPAQPNGRIRIDRGKSPGVVGFRKPGPTVPDLLPGVSLTVLGWAIA